MKTKINLFLFFIAIGLYILISCHPEKHQNEREKLHLGGVWQMQLDFSDQGIKEQWFNKDLETMVKLPGTLDENKKGINNTDSIDMHLNRPFKYEGAAWYRKEITIPEDWKDKSILLVMERTKVTHVWIDSVYLGTNNTIFTKQVYHLPENLNPGTHFISILVDNSLDLVPVEGSHAYEDNTQTNWNGIIGEFELEAVSAVHIKSVQVYPDVDNKTVEIKIKIKNPENKLKKFSIKLNANSWNNNNKQKAKPLSKIFNIHTEDTAISITYSLGNHPVYWSEFDPGLYRINISLQDKSKTIDNQTVNFGFRKFSQNGDQFVINDITTFLRGKHDACVFPLTGYPPMDTSSWNRVFRIAKSYGINHFRYHSWCPPAAAFLSADVNGIYLQSELPIWWGFHSYDTAHYNYMIKEGKNIMDNYGNHASFVMFSLGNEIFQNREHLQRMVSFFRDYDNRHLYAQGSNNWLNDPKFAEGDDFWVTFRTSQEKADQSSDVRGSVSFLDSKIGDGGIINSRYPSTLLNYSKAIESSPVPVIGHEIGQYSIYPNYDQITKYTGVLKPWNLEIFRKRLENNGMGDQANDFFKASGALSVICYREDIEMAIRTPEFGGFQLLDLQDFPGQGTALIGILDAFMDSKGIISPDEFRNFCNDIVVLLEFSKYCWINNETYNAEIIVANYSDRDIINPEIAWSIKNDNSELKSEVIKLTKIEKGKLNKIGKIEYKLDNISDATKLNINVKINKQYQNNYPIWVYPDFNIDQPKDIIITHDLNIALQNLKEGSKVLLFPDHEKIIKNSVGGQCIPEFWNYAMFKKLAEEYGGRVSEGTMGILTTPDHPVFKEFPTEFYTNWQWWPMIKNSRPLILDRTHVNYRPIVQVIDNINRNHKLGLIFEFKVGNGKLLISSTDLSDLTVFPEAKQLYKSVLDYMNSESFNPTENISDKSLRNLLYN